MNEIFEVNGSGTLLITTIDVGSNTKLTLFRIDSRGDTLWSKSHPLGFYVDKSFPTSDSSFIILGSDTYLGHILKIDTSGNIIWNKSFDFSNAGYQTRFKGGHQLSSGDILIASQYQVPGLVSLVEIGLFKMNLNGDSLGYEPITSYAASTQFELKSEKMTDQSTILSIQKNGEIDLIKVSTQMVIDWQKTILAPNKYYYCLTATKDTGIVLGGVIPNTSYSGIISKVNSVGDTVWNKILNSSANWGLNSGVIAIICTKDGGLMTGGNVVNRFDSLGNHLWRTNSFASDNIIQLTDSAYIAVDNNGSGFKLNRFFDKCTSAHNVYFSGSLAFCPGDSTTLTAHGGNNYFWNYIQSPTYTTDTTETVILHSVFGNELCGDTVQAKIAYNTIQQPICFVTVNNGKNKIIWEKNNEPEIVSYNIYKESSAFMVFNLIGNVPVADSSVFSDTASMPDIKSEIYVIHAVDTCGNVFNVPGGLFNYYQQKTIHLTINKGQGNNWNLMWNNYAGVGMLYNSVNILRGYTPNNLSVLTTLSNSNNSYTDGTSTNDSVYYAIEVIPLDTCQPGRSAYSVRSNVVFSTVTSIPEVELNNFKFYPNPVSENLNYEFDFEPGKDCTGEIIDLSGRLVSTFSITGKKGSIPTGDLEKGIMYIRIKGVSSAPVKLTKL